MTPGQDRAGAGRVDEAEARAHQQSRAEAALRAGVARLGDDAADPGFHSRRHRRQQQGDPEAEQDGDGDVAQEIVGQPKRVDHVDERDGGEREREGQPGDDPERPPPAAAQACREDHRQHRENAR